MTFETASASCCFVFLTPSTFLLIPNFLATATNLVIPSFFRWFVLRSRSASVATVSSEGSSTAE